MAKDAKGHGSNGRGGAVTEAGKRLELAMAGAAARRDSERAASVEQANREAANALASGPKSDTVPVHDSMTHNDQGHAWGSPEALKDFRDKYNAGRAAGRAKNMQDFGPRNHAAEQRGFNSGKREINRLRKQGK